MLSVTPRPNADDIENSIPATIHRNAHSTSRPYSIPIQLAPAKPKPQSPHAQHIAKHKHEHEHAQEQPVQIHQLHSTKSISELPSLVASLPPHVHSSKCIHAHPVRSHSPKISSLSLSLPLAQVHSSHPRQSFWNLTCCCLFSLIPDDIMLFNIFAFLTPKEILTSANMVSTRWNWLAGDKILWNKLDLSSYSNSVNDDVLMSLLEKYGSFLDVLKLCNNSLLQSKGLSSISSFAPNLREIHFCNIGNVTDDIIISISKSCGEKLTSISLFGCNQITDTAIISLNDNCRYLTDLSVRGCHKITDKSFENLSSHIAGLNIGGCRLITPAGLSTIAHKTRSNLQRLNAHGITLADSGILDLASECTNLSTLHLSSSNPFGGNPRVTDYSISKLSALKHLTCLNLQGSSNITDECMEILLPNIIDIQRINLGGVYRLTDKTLSLFAKYSRKLTHLSLFQLFNITDKGLILLLKSLNRIIHLDLHSCVGLSPLLLNELAKINQVDAHQLKHAPLALDDDDDDDNYGEIASNASTANESKDVASGNPTRAVLIAPALSVLDLGSIRNIKTADVEAFKTKRPQVNVIHY